jgi:ATP-binding cassette subfamily B protein
VNQNKNIQFFLDSLQPFKWLIAGQFFVGAVWAAYLSFRPYMLKIILDKIPNLTPETVVAGLWAPIVFFLCAMLCVVLVSRLNDFIWLYLNPPLKRHVGNILMRRMMGHSILSLQNHFAGNLANKVKEVMSGIPDVLKLISSQFFTNFLGLFIAIFTVWTINYSFALLLAAWLMVFVIGVCYFSIKAQNLCNSASAIRSSVIGYMVDILGNMASIHLFSAKESESKKLHKRFDEWVIADQDRDWLFLKMFAFQGISFVLYQAIGFVFLVAGFKQGTVTAGDFALLLTINGAIITNLWTLSADILKCSELVGNINQGLLVALAPLDMQNAADAREIRIEEGRIVFDAVQFGYRGTSPIFENKSIVIEPGQKVGLVGYSGSGKSTFVNLILRLYDVTSGRILIDGQDIRHVTLKSLRDSIAMIPQDPSMFNRSVMENIRYGRPDATDAEVIQAAKRAHAHDFIVRLAQGYNSPVGERGSKLSGGQRQRIAIARAILKNSPILMLDEATSQLDSVTENDIQDSLSELMQNKTTLVVAHRLSTLLHMDRILVFDKGKIVEDGTHDELIARGGLYKTLWSAQVGGFLPSNLAEKESRFQA